MCFLSRIATFGLGEREGVEWLFSGRAMAEVAAEIVSLVFLYPSSSSSLGMERRMGQLSAKIDECSPQTTVSY